MLRRRTLSGHHPQNPKVSDHIPSPATDYLQQAQESIHAPAGAIMLCGSAVDAMLKAHNYTTGSLYSRIDKAKEDGIITEGMAKWSHRVRLDANKPRHADKDAPLPDEKDAKRSFEFSMALGEILFVLPARVTSGIASGTGGEDESN